MTLGHTLLPGGGSLKSRYWIVAAGCGALILTGLASYPQNRNTPQQPLLMPRAIGFQITLGVDRVPATWDGSVQVSSGQITKIQGLAFADGDETDGKASWKLRTRPAPAAAAQKAAAKKAELAPENGVLVSVTGAGLSMAQSLYVGDVPLLRR